MLLSIGSIIPMPGPVESNTHSSTYERLSFKMTKISHNSRVFPAQLLVILRNQCHIQVVENVTASGSSGAGKYDCKFDDFRRAHICVLQLLINVKTESFAMKTSSKLKPVHFLYQSHGIVNLRNTYNVTYTNIVFGSEKLKQHLKPFRLGRRNFCRPIVHNFKLLRAACFQ